MASIYRHSYFAKKHLNYYEARGILFKEGYKMTGYNPNWKETGVGVVDFSDGICYITLRTNMIPRVGDPTKLKCDKVINVFEYTDD